MIQKINIVMLLICGLCTQFSQAQISGKGGAIYLTGGGKIEACLIKDNQAATEGTGVYIENGVVTSSTIVNNEQIRNAAYGKVLPAGMVLLPIPGGTYTMGRTGISGEANNTNEKPEHPVSVSDFLMSETEVTTAQYCEFLNAAEVNATGCYVYTRNAPFSALSQLIIDTTSTNTHDYEYVNSQWQAKSGLGNRPMAWVSWYGATAFCDFYGLRLPSEEEWEYAARGGTNNIIYAGATSNDATGLSAVGWYAENSDGHTHDVKTKLPNAYGLYDMSGNVCEWPANYGTASFNPADLSNSGTASPASPRINSYALRGGGYANALAECRVSMRRAYNANTIKNAAFGFRVCL